MQKFLNLKFKKVLKYTENPIKDIRIPREAIFGGIIRDEKAIMPHGNVQIITGDKVIVFCLPEAISAVERLFK